MRLDHDCNQVLKFYGIFFPCGESWDSEKQKQMKLGSEDFFPQISSHYRQLTYFPNWLQYLKSMHQALTDLRYSGAFWSIHAYYSGS